MRDIHRKNFITNLLHEKLNNMQAYKQINKHKIIKESEEKLAQDMFG